jgi:putative folate metabolism gamma-glutamate ligase
MHVDVLKTGPVLPGAGDLLAILDAHVPAMPEAAILAITSKIVALCQGRVAPVETTDKAALIRQEADYFLPPHGSRPTVWLTVKDGHLIPAAGIDESNAAGHFVLWPERPQAVANHVRAYLRQRFDRQQVGVIITDSTTTPLRWGVTGTAVAHSGFLAVRNLVGTPDLFGRPLRMTKVAVADALAAAAVLVMGEGDEQTPLALLTDLPFITFQDRDPTPQELAELRIPLEEDLYAPLLAAVEWQRGGAAGGAL